MAKYDLGEGFIKIAPNANLFHTKARAALKEQDAKHGKIEYEIPVKLDEKEFEKEVRRLKAQIQAFEENPIQLKFELDDSEVKQKLAVLQAADGQNLKIGVDLDDTEARRRLQEHDNRQMKADLYIDVHREEADVEIRDFVDKHNGRAIDQFVQMKFPANLPNPFENYGKQLEGSVSGGAKKAFRTIQWDVVNFLPSVWKVMGQQFDKGMREIYNPYLKTTETVLKNMAKPYKNLKTWFAQVHTIHDGVDQMKAKWGSLGETIQTKVLKRLDRYGRLADRYLGGVGAQFVKGLRESIGAASFETDKIWLAIENRAKKTWSGIQNSARRFSNYVKDVFVIIIQERVSLALFKLRNTATQVLDKMRAGVSFVSSGFQLLYATVRSKSVEVFEKFKATAVKAADHVRNSFSKVFAVFASFGGRIVAPFTKAFQKIREATSRVVDSIKHVMLGVGRGFQYAFDPLLNIGRKITAPVVNAFRNLSGKIAETFSGIGGRIKHFLEGSFSGLRSLKNLFVGFGKGLGGQLMAGMRFAIHKAYNSPWFLKLHKYAFAKIGQVFSGFSRVALGAFQKVAGAIVQSFVPAVGAAAAGIAALGTQAALGSVLALGGALFSAAQGALLLAPALGAAAGISFAVLKIGLKDVKSAVGQAFSAETLEDFESGIEKMHPSVQKIARAMREFKPAMDEMKNAIQENLLAGLDEASTRVMNNLFPTFSAGTRAMASEWNAALHSMFDELSSDRARAGLEDIFVGVGTMAREMKNVLANLTAGFGSLAQQGAKFLGPIGESIANTSESFVGWAESLREIDESTGLSKFDQIMQSAGRNAGYLKDILGGLAGALGNVFKAGAEGGVALLEGMATGAQELKRITEEGSAGYEKLLGFMRSATQAAQQIKPLIEPLFTVITTIGTGLANLAGGALPGITKLVDGFAQGLQPILDITNSFGQNLGNGLAALAPFIEQLGAALAPVLDSLSAGLGQALQGLGQALQTIGPALQQVGQALGPVLETIGGVLADVFIAIAPAIESALGLVAQFAQALAPLAEKFGELVTKVIDGIVPAFEKNDEVFGKLIDTLGGALIQIMDALIQVVEKLAPHVGTLAEGFARVLEALIPVIPTFAELGVAIAESLVDLLDKLLPHLPTLIDLIVLLAQFIGGKLTVELTVLKAIWEALWPVISFFIDLIMFALKPQLELLGFGIQALGKIFEVVFPAGQSLFESMGETFKKVAGWIKDKVENVITPAIEAIKHVSARVRDGLREVWDSMAAIFRKPIKFMIDVVLNSGFVDAWNWVADKLGFDKVSKVASPDMAYASGGVLPGYTPGRDPHKFYSPTGGNLKLSGGEAIMRPEWTKAVGGPAAVEAMNKTARTGGVRGVQRMLGEGAAFADGGVVDLDKKIASLFNALKSEHGKPYQYGGTGNPSWDCSGLWSGITQHLNGGNLRGGRIFNTESVFENFGFKKGLSGRVTIGVMRGGGGPNSHMAGTIDGVNIESAGDHGVQIGGSARGSDHSMFNLHWTLEKFLGKFVSGGNGGGGFMQALLNGFFEVLEKTIFGPIKSMIPGDPKWVNLPATGFVDKVVDGLKTWASEQFGSSDSGAPYDGPIHGGVEQWRPLVEKVLREKGLPVSQAQHVLFQMQKESGGDPNIVNNWDSNAAAGTPSKGLMQVIDPTFQANKDPGFNNIYDPESNIRASINYALRTYGTLPAAYRGVGYDQGGVANGVGIMPKYTIKPERVLSPTQTQAFNDFVYKLMPEMIRGFHNLPEIFAQGFDGVAKAVTKPYEFLEEEKRWKEAKDKELEGKELSEEEKARVEEMKKDGSFYYGYQVFNDDGSNPNEYKLSEHENMVVQNVNKIADSLGSGEAANAITQRVGVLQSLGSSVQTALPAWQAALAGDPTGLQHNIAAATAKWHEEFSAGVQQLIPDTIAGVFEMVASSGAQRNAPFIGTVNTGMSQAEFENALSRYRAQEARQGLGGFRAR